MHRPALIRIASTMTLLCAAGCAREPFDAPLTLGGVEVSAATLNLGHRTFQTYCRACHGVNGDGRGPASDGLRPSPRDFRRGIFKFARVEMGDLPTDADLERTVRNGLAGTAMMAWDLGDDERHAVIQYIKTFSPRWRDGVTQVGTPIPLADDPWGASRAAEAIRTGRALYHGLAQCGACHPSYAPYEEIRRDRLVQTGHAPDDLGPQIYQPRDTPDQYADPRMRVPPPDFTQQPMRSARDLPQLYLTIAAGIGGTAMPTWYGALTDQQLWALTHYVQSLIDLRGTPEAARLRRELASQPLPVYPTDRPAAGR